MKKLFKQNIILSFAIFLAVLSMICAIIGYYSGGVIHGKKTSLDVLQWSMDPSSEYDFLNTTDDEHVYLAGYDDKSEQHLLDPTGKILDKMPGTDLGHGYYEVKEDEAYGVCDKEGNMLIDASYDYIESEGNYFITHTENERIAFWNLQGECIYEEPQIAYAKYLGEDKFLVNQEGLAKSYVIDLSTMEKQPLAKHIEFVKSDGNGGLMGSVGGLYYPLDENFDVVEGGPVYEYYDELSDGLRYVTIYDEKTGKSSPCYIDKKGEVVISLEQIPDNAGPFSEGKALVQTGRTLVCIDKSGKELFTLKCKVNRSNFQIYRDYCYSEGYAAVSLDDAYGYIDETGEFVIPPVLDTAEEIKNGYAIAAIDGYQYGILKFD